MLISLPKKRLVSKIIHPLYTIMRVLGMVVEVISSLKPASAKAFEKTYRVSRLSLYYLILRVFHDWQLTRLEFTWTGTGSKRAKRAM